MRDVGSILKTQLIVRMQSTFQATQYLELSQFAEMDYHAMEQLKLPVPLMMENAGLQLARLITQTAQPRDQILIGVGNENLQKGR